MNSEASSKMGTSCANSVSFPNTRTRSTESFSMGSKVFKFQPVKSEVLLKQLLEDDEESPKPDKYQNKPKTSHLMSHRGKYANPDSDSSDDEDKSNILDKTITEDDSILNNKDLVPGVSWLDSPENRKPVKIVVKPVPSTPMTNMFNKLSIRNQTSVKKEPRAVSLEREHEEKLRQAPAINNNIFKTPCYKNSKIIPSSSTIRKYLPSERSAIPSSNNQYLSTKKLQLELTTPKQQRLPIQTNDMCETPRQTSILHAAIPRTALQSTTKDKIIKSSVKNSDIILREKNMNVLQRQQSDPITKSLQESTFQQLKVKGIDYIVINKIGEGGSGQVYRCLEQETLQDRAIKVVNLNVDPATVDSYVNEVKMLKELQGNDRVIRMYDYELIHQNLFVVMEKGDVDFSIFLRNITNEPQIQTHVIVCYWIEMLKCVREIHKKGIIHSDLKPSNFLIIGGRLKLIDFGIASRLTTEMTSVIKNVTVGTFNYISPEALLDSGNSPTDGKPQLKISYKSDVWSLGCILYQMVYKRTPFHFVGNMWAKFAVITDKNHKIEYQQIPGVPLFIIDMIKKCLVYDMKSRPTVEELINMYYSGNYC